MSACLVSALLLFLATSCGEGFGDRCQVNSDCESGLSCCNVSQGNGQCGPLNCDFGGASSDASVDTSPAEQASEVEMDAESSEPEEAETSGAAEFVAAADGVEEAQSIAP
jgi:hypothetical protein